MSVNKYNKGKNADELEIIASRGQRVFVGTQKSFDEAMARGDIGNASVVYITDDYSDNLPNVIANNATNEAGDIIALEKNIPSLQMIFDLFFPVSTPTDTTTYLQSPGSLPPKEKFAKSGIISEWELVPTEGEFIRLSGGNAQPFENQTSCQADQIRSHHHTMNHYHAGDDLNLSGHLYNFMGDGPNAVSGDGAIVVSGGSRSRDWVGQDGNSVRHFTLSTGDKWGNGTTTGPVNGNNSSSIPNTGSTGGNETRPINKTWNLWFRIS